MPVRKIPKNHLVVTGRHASAKSVGDADFESLLEAEHLILLDFDQAVRSYEVQPVSIGVPAKKTTYVPDVLAHFHPGANGAQRASELIEVKPKALLKKYRTEFKPKFKAARAFAEERGWRFVIKSEREIRTQRLENLKFLRRYRSIHVEPDALDWITRRLAEVGGRASEAQLLGADAVGIEDRLRLLPALWHLVVKGRLVVNLDSLIKADTQIYLPVSPP